MRYFATATITALALSSLEWSLPIALVLALVTFWHEWRQLVDRVRQDRRIRKDAKDSVHFKASAKDAHKSFHG
jgi:hypothetical protein